MMLDDRVVGVDLQPRAVEIGSFVEPAQEHQRARHRVTRLKVLGPEQDRVAVRGQAFFDALLRQQRDRQVVPGLPEIGLRRDRAPAQRFGLDVFAALAVDRREIAERVDEVGVAVQALAVGGLGFFETLRFDQHVAQVVPGPGLARHRGDGLADQRDRGVAVAGLVPQHAQEMQRVALPRPALQDALQRERGLVELLRAQQLDSVLELLALFELRRAPRDARHPRGGAFSRTHRRSRRLRPTTPPCAAAHPWTAASGTRG